jgi:two-component system response regulator HydG
VKPATAFEQMIGDSVAMAKVRRLIEKVAQKKQPVLIVGESGTGKELVAQAIHRLGSEAEDDVRPFVAVDCAALQPTLVESELFGHVAGAFTGATKTKRGLFEAADGGTLFLDEIGELSLESQAKLLRSLQQKEIRAVGAVESKKIDVRVVAATNRDLSAEVEQKRFREDLYFRLAVVTIRVPALRERREDIPLLAKRFAKRAAAAGFDARITDEAMKLLVAYNWPGNVRELENAIERAVALNTTGPIRKEDLPTTLMSAALAGGTQPGSMEAAEKHAIVHALKKTSGNKLEAAKMLGIGKTTLYRKLKDYAIEV